LPSPDELLLRTAFDELRTLDRAHVPPFRSPGQPRSAVLHWTRPLAAAMLALFVVLTFSVLVHKTPAIENVSMSDWKAPTDFLLQTPHADLLRNVPEFGERNVTQ
jgi:hypothetical protein